MLVLFIRNGDGVLGLMCEGPDALFDRIEDTFKKIGIFYHYSPVP
jgi:hypothetical protein